MAQNKKMSLGSATNLTGMFSSKSTRSLSLVTTTSTCQPAQTYLSRYLECQILNMILAILSTQSIVSPKCTSSTKRTTSPLTSTSTAKSLSSLAASSSSHNSWVGNSSTKSSLNSSSPKIFSWISQASKTGFKISISRIFITNFCWL